MNSHLVLSPWHVSFVRKPSLFPDPFLPLVFGLCSLSTVCLRTNGSLCPIWHFLSFTSQRNLCPWSVLDSNQPRCLWALLFTDLPLLPSWSLNCTCTDLFCLLCLYLWCFPISFTVVISFDFFSFMYYCPLLRNFCYYIFIFLKKISSNFKIKPSYSVLNIFSLLHSSPLSPAFDSGFHSLAQAVCKFRVIPKPQLRKHWNYRRELSSSAAVFLSLHSSCVLIPSFTS